MKVFVAALAGLIAFSNGAVAKNWTSQTSDGIKEARVALSDVDEILVLCDVGVNAPITSINFLINGTSPIPNSNIRMVFDRDQPMFIPVDAEGGIGSLNATDADLFEKIVALLKSKSKVKVRLFDGSEEVFRLSGSSKAIGTCATDYSRYQIASN